MRLWPALLALPLLGAASPGNAPSFACTGSLNPSERAICSDPELSAWDRAIALIFPNGRVSSLQQKAWLKDRDTCGSDKACLRRSYADWPGYPSAGPWPVYMRHAGNDDATLMITPIGGGWFAFSATAIHYVLDQRGRFLTANDGEADGVVLVAAGKGRFSADPGDEFGCEIDFTQLKKGRRLQDNGRCGGVNVTMNGVYFLQRKTKRS